MPVSLMRNGLTAENSIFSQKPNIHVPRSRFDLSRLNVFTSDIGMIVPVDLIPTLPNDDFDLYCQYKIDFRPLIVPTLTPYKVRVHYYYCPLSYLWEGAESFLSKGRSGSLNLTIPSVSLDSANRFSDSRPTLSSMLGLTDKALTHGANFIPVCTGSLVDYLCGSIPIANADTARRYLPFISTYTDSDKMKGATTGFNIHSCSVLPFLMYQKIYRSNYLDPNLMSNGIVESQCS